MRWASTVLRETNRAAAASTLLSPRPTARATWSSCGLRESRAEALAVVPGVGPGAGGVQFDHRPGRPRPRAQAVEDGEGVPEGPAGSGGTAGAAQRLTLAEQRAGLLERHRLSAGTPSGPWRTRPRLRPDRGRGSRAPARPQPAGRPGPSRRPAPGARPGPARPARRRRPARAPRRGHRRTGRRWGYPAPRLVPASQARSRWSIAAVRSPQLSAHSPSAAAL